jgi:hypothetical protein
MMRMSTKSISLAARYRSVVEIRDRREAEQNMRTIGRRAAAIGERRTALSPTRSHRRPATDEATKRLCHRPPTEVNTPIAPDVCWM